MSLLRKLLIISLLICCTGCATTAARDNGEVNFKNVGLQAIATKNYPVAITNLGKAIAKEPTDPLLYAYRATAYFGMNKFPEAKADLTKSIDIYPEFPQAFFNRGIVETSLMEFQAAIDDYSRGIRLSHDTDYVYKRGTLYLWTKQYDNAEKDFNEVIAARPKFALPYNDRGQLYLAKGDLDKAIADYSRAIELKPRNGEFYVNRADAYDRKGKQDLATADRRKACEVGDEGMCEELASKR